VKSRKSPAGPLLPLLLDERQFEKFWVGFDPHHQYGSDTKKMIRGLCHVIWHSNVRPWLYHEQNKQKGDYPEQKQETHQVKRTGPWDCHL
jgi:hypothetical protein